jgi:hypothetical protein
VFRGLESDQATFGDTEFQDYSDFDSARFNVLYDFAGATFESDVNFHRAAFPRLVNIAQDNTSNAATGVIIPKRNRMFVRHRAVIMPPEHRPAKCGP